MAILKKVNHDFSTTFFAVIQFLSAFFKMADQLMECFGDTVMGYLPAAATNRDHSHRSTAELASESGIRNLFLHHLLQLRFNSHRVTATVTEPASAGGREDEVVQSSHESHIGSAVFLTASLFNHSCWPNIIFR